MRHRKPEETRVEILEAAIKVMALKGPLGLTLDAVVEEVPYSKGALLHHFPNKMALLEGVVDHLGQAFLDQVMAEAAKDPEPYGRNARAYLMIVINDPVTDTDVSIGRAALAACAAEPSLAERWVSWVRKARQDDPEDPVGADDALLLRLMADGLWMSDMFGTHEVSPQQRKALASLLMPGRSVMESGR